MAPRSGSPDGSSSTTSSESTGSPDSYPNDEYLRLPDRVETSPLTPQVDYSKLVGSEEVSPLDPCRSQLSPMEASTTVSLDSPTFGSTYLQNADLQPKVPSSQPVITDEEWSDIPLSVEGSARLGEPPGSTNPESAAPTSLGQLGRRQSIDALFSGSTGKVKEIFSQGIMKLNIGSISERRGSLESCRRKVGGPQRPSSRTSRYSTDEGASSNEDPQSSDEMLSDDQIASLMLDEDLRSGNTLASKSK
uniref:FMRFamide-like neuropeptides 3 n=1 Tax=Lygus hesperus TaxID=30085 RepID=A0A0A9WGD5_LYGHE